MSLIGRCLKVMQAVAKRYCTGHPTTDLGDLPAKLNVDAVIPCTPTPTHAVRAIECMDAARRVQINIPIVDSLAVSEAVSAEQHETDPVCMVGHTRHLKLNP